MAKTRKLPAFPKPQLDNSITIINSQRAIAISIPSAKKVIQFLLENSGTKGMALYFVGKKKISTLHDDFFNDPSPTDCITFPIHETDFLGEVFICPQVAQEYCNSHGGDLYQEITLYIVHGFLHLLGLDDRTSMQRQEMRREEKKWLLALAKNNVLITP